MDQARWQIDSKHLQDRHRLSDPHSISARRQVTRLSIKSNDNQYM